MKGKVLSCDEIICGIKGVKGKGKDKCDEGANAFVIDAKWIFRKIINHIKDIHDTACSFAPKGHAGRDDF